MDIALSSLRFAFQSVKENQGCAGVDRVSIRMFEENEGVNLQVLQDELYRKVYRPYPLMKVLIPKKDEETPRNLCIPTVRDRIVQKTVLNLIEPILDKEFEETSFAYRKGYSVKRAVHLIRSLYEQGYRFIIDADIDDYFDSVDHDILMTKFQRFIDNKDIQNLVRLWIKADIWDGTALVTPTQGIPQGSPMSPVLANLFLDEIDERLSESGCKYVRYADNYLLLGKNEAEARNSLDLSTELLDTLDLELEVEKTASFDKGFTFLGVFFFNDLIMKPFARPEKEQSTPVFPAPFDINAWRCSTQEKAVTMANLYITEQNSILRKTGNRLILEKDDKILLDVQCHKIDAVLIFGNVQFTTQAVNELFDQGIEMSILSRNGRLKGQISSPFTKNIELRLMQFKLYWDDTFRLNVSKAILSGKIQNSLNMIRRFAYNHAEIGLSAELSDIAAIQKMTDAATLLDQLFGMEGSAAKFHFKALGKMVLKEFAFEHRSKRPPKDPVNALLSLTYTMIYNEISSLLDGLGFDPYLGYFHHPDYGRASLASDLMEEFRAPVGDGFTLNMINKGILTSSDFYSESGGGFLLKRDALKRYFAEYETFVNREFDHPATKTRTSFRKAFRSQAETMAKAIRSNGEYMPFIMEV